MKICIWFLIFVLPIFDGVLALADSDFVPATPATSLIQLICNFAEWFAMCEGVHMLLDFFNCHTFDKVMALCLFFWHFPNF